MQKNRILFYVHFNKLNKLSKHVIYQIKKLRPTYDTIVFITNSTLNEVDKKTISKYVNELIQRENVGYDFAAWRDGMKAIGWDDVKKYGSVTVMNDTCFGPLYDMESVYKKMDNSDCDFWGITDHAFAEKGMPGTDKCIPRHLQSYFMVFKKNIVSSRVFYDFWFNIEDYSDVFKVIQNYETRMTGLFEEAGFKSLSLFDTITYSRLNNNNVPNYSELQPLIAIQEGVPFVKVKAFIWTPYDKICKAIKLKSNYPLSLINNHLSVMGICFNKENYARTIKDIIKKTYVFRITKKIFKKSRTLITGETHE